MKCHAALAALATLALVAQPLAAAPLSVSRDLDVEEQRLTKARQQLGAAVTNRYSDSVAQLLKRYRADNNELTVTRKVADDANALWRAAVADVKAGNLDGALQELNALIARAPDFHLAYLVRGDLLLSRVQPVTALGRNALLAALSTGSHQPALQQLRDEARLRLQGVVDAQSRDHLPRQILALGDSVQNALLVDKSNHRLYVYQRDDTGQLQMVRDYYVSTGKQNGDKYLRGDLRTPEGVYFLPL